MAGTRKTKMHAGLCFLVLYFIARPGDCTSCLSNQNTNVDWFIAYKLPDSEKSIPQNSFFYMDADSTTWTLSPKTLAESGQAIYNTLNQIYKKQNTSVQAEDFMYLMYNDEPPKSLKYRRLRGSNNGHTKGVIAFDSKSGFWLIHSTPKFPPLPSAGYSWPESAHTYGQSFLCVSMATNRNLDEIGIQLQYNYPDIYSNIFPQPFSTYKHMSDAIAGQHVTSQPWYREAKLISLRSVTFLSFAKYADFNSDLYSTWLAPRFGSSLLVESWQNGRSKLCSNCTGKYKVFNIENLGFKQPEVEFKETQDHSKWAVTNSTASVWTCIGDINRQLSQEKRPGGTVCFQNKSVWQNFHSLISSYHNCGPYRECVPP